MEKQRLIKMDTDNFGFYGRYRCLKCGKYQKHYYLMSKNRAVTKQDKLINEDCIYCDRVHRNM